MSLDHYLYFFNAAQVNQKLKELYDKIQKCKKCSLSILPVNSFRPFFKPGKAPIVIVSQNPSFFRDETCDHVWGGLDKLPESVKQKIPLDVPFITNVLKCSTFRNNAPEQRFIDACREWLTRELLIISPRRIIALGKVAGQWFHASPSFDDSPAAWWNNVPVYCTYHPAYILRRQKLKVNENNYALSRFVILLKRWLSWKS